MNREGPESARMPPYVRNLFIAALGLSALFGLYEIRTFDTFFHLATGRLILEQGEVPAVDPFSFTFRGAPWENHSWGYQTALAALHALGGFSALSLLQAALACATCALGLLSVLRVPSLFPWAIALSVLPHAAFREVLEARPHMLAFVCLGATLHVTLEVYRRNLPLRLLILMPVYLVWASSHGSHLLMFVILALAIASALIEKQRKLAMTFALTCMGALLLCAALAPGAFYQGGEHVASSFLETSVREWAPVTPDVLLYSFQGRAFFGIVLLSVLGILPLATDTHSLKHGLTRGPLPPLLFACFVLLAFTSLRMLALCSIGAAPLFLPFAARALARIAAQVRLGAASARFVPALALLALSAVLWTGRADFQLGAGLMDSRFPVHAVDALRRDPALKRVYNAYNFGGYLMWERTPQAGVFVDGRAITIYPASFLTRFEQAYVDARRFEELATEYAVDSVLMPTKSPRTQRLLGYLRNHPRYALRYEDEVATLYQRLPVHAP